MASSRKQEGATDLWINTGTEQAALFSIITFLKKKGIVADKNAAILVPKFTSTQLLQLLRKHCAPTVNQADNISIALVTHVFGFPQNMNAIQNICTQRGIALVEDCSDVLDVPFNDQALGTFGLAAVYRPRSYSPFLSGGCLRTESKELFDHALETRRSRNECLASTLQTFVNLVPNIGSLQYSRHVRALQDMADATAEYAQLPNAFSFLASNTLLKENIARHRLDNYRFYRSSLEPLGFFDLLPKEEIIPLVLPLIGRKQRLEEISVRLLSKGINVAWGKFDTNSNLFDPNFHDCLKLPINQQIDRKKLTLIVDTIKGAS
jgi:DegT/DnrJ/EryC1/StrS aminotransferase family